MAMRFDLYMVYVKEQKITFLVTHFKNVQYYDTVVDIVWSRRF